MKQEALEAFLASSSAFSDGTRKVEVIETHGAKIFLGRTDVYKIKRPVNLGYLDFSTLDKREIACRREFALNRDAAPSVYKGVVSINRSSAGELKINGDGEVLEWAVHMKRFEQASILLDMARNGILDDQVSATLGRKIALAHLELSPVCRSGGAARVADTLTGVRERIASPLLALPEAVLADFDNQSTSLLEELKSDLDERAEQGCVRRCHGDLHLGNIIMINGEPVPIDALEFDERFAETDVLYDLAFLLMDLLHRGLRKQANLTFNRYCAHAWPLVERQGFRVLPFFMALRAAIRAMVDRQRTTLAGNNAQQMPDESLDYLNQAVGYLKQPQPRLYAVGGLSGTGKSTLGAELAARTATGCGALLLRSDLERKVLFSVPEFEKLPAGSYTQAASDTVYARLMDKARQALQQGQSVLLDAVFANQNERYAAADLARLLEVPFVGFWLDAPPEVLLARVRNRKQDASDADEQVVLNQVKLFAGIPDALDMGWIALKASGTPEETLALAMAVLQSGGNGFEPLNSAATSSC